MKLNKLDYEGTFVRCSRVLVKDGRKQILSFLILLQQGEDIYALYKGTQ